MVGLEQALHPQLLQALRPPQRQTTQQNRPFNCWATALPRWAAPKPHIRLISLMLSTLYAVWLQGTFLLRLWPSFFWRFLYGALNLRQCHYIATLFLLSCIFFFYLHVIHASSREFLSKFFYSHFFLCINREVPLYTEGSLMLNSQQHNRATRHSNTNFICPKFNCMTECGKLFTVTTCQLWNSLSLELRNSVSLVSLNYFKNNYRNNLLIYNRNYIILLFNIWFIFCSLIMFYCYSQFVFLLDWYS